MATEMLWVSLDGRSRTNSPSQRFHTQLCYQIVRYFCRTLYDDLQLHRRGTYRPTASVCLYKQYAVMSTINRGNERKCADSPVTSAILNTSSKIPLAILHIMVASIFGRGYRLTESKQAFLDVKQCTLIHKHRIFRAISCLHHPGWRMMVQSLSCCWMSCSGGTFFFAVALRPNAGHGLLILEVF